MKQILAGIIIAGVILGSACLFLPNFALSEGLTHVLRCESDGFAPQSCFLPFSSRDSEIKEVRMIKQLSGKPCIEGKSWSASESEIIVRNGCRAEFLVSYRAVDRSERRDRWHNRSDSRHRQEESDYSSEDSSPQYAESPTDIIIRSFEDIYNRRPSREEMRFYRSLIIDEGWTERQIRHDLRYRSQSDGQ